MNIQIFIKINNFLNFKYFYKIIFFRNILIYKMYKKIIQKKILPPYSITQLELGNYKTRCNYTRKEIYASARKYSCLHPEYNILETREFENRFVYEVSDVVVDTLTGNIFDRSSSLILESSSWSTSWHVLANAPGVNSIPLSHKFLKYEAKKSLIVPSNSFFHWVSEDIAPIIFLLKNRPTADILVYKHAPKYVIDFLKASNLNFKFVERYVKFQNYEFVSKIKDNSWPDLVDINIVRDYFHEKRENEIVNNVNKIYISRVNSKRSPSFEKDLCILLANNGWEIVYTEDLKLEEQISKFQHADVIAGIQGAGLVGAIWSKPSCTLVEITNSDWRYTPVLARLAAALEIKFKRINYSEKEDRLLDRVYYSLDNIAII